MSLVRKSAARINQREMGSAVEHHIDIVGVTGSIPVSSTQRSGVANRYRPRSFISDLEKPSHGATFLQGNPAPYLGALDS